MMSGMSTWGGMVGWKGAMPKSSHHRGLARCQEKGKKEWSAGAPASRSCRRTMSQWGGGGMDEVSGGVHLDVGVLRLPHRVSAHGIEELVNAGRWNACLRSAGLAFLLEDGSTYLQTIPVMVPFPCGVQVHVPEGLLRGHQIVLICSTPAVCLGLGLFCADCLHTA